MTKKRIDPDNVRAALAATSAVVDAVAGMGDDGLPAGPLYAAMMGKVSHENFERLLGVLVEQRILTRDGFHVLRLHPEFRPRYEEAKQGRPN